MEFQYSIPLGKFSEEDCVVRSVRMTYDWSCIQSVSIWVSPSRDSKTGDVDVFVPALSSPHMTESCMTWSPLLSTKV